MRVFSVVVLSVLGAWVLVAAALGFTDLVRAIWREWRSR